MPSSYEKSIVIKQRSTSQRSKPNSPPDQRIARATALPTPMWAGEKFGRTSAPRLPQAVQTKPGLGYVEPHSPTSGEGARRHRRDAEEFFEQLHFVAVMGFAGLNPSSGWTTRPAQVICPSGCLLTGVSTLISDFPKNISVPIHPKSNLQLSSSHPTRGAYHDRHGRGEGCGGRSSVGRAMRAQGGLLSVSG